MTEQEVRQLRAEVMARKNVPTLPAVLAKILQLCGSIDSNSRELIGIIEKDQALTGKILRLANSAFFGQSRRVATIPRAVILLGFANVRNLTLSVKVWDTLGTGIARVHLQALWAHAVACAMAGKALAASLRMGDPDEAFTAGLLHDVGRLILAMRFRDEYWTVAQGDRETSSIDACERGAFGVDHAEVGAWMLEAWALPPAVVERVRVHHDGSAELTETRLVGIAARLVDDSDLATGEVRPAALALLEQTGGQGLTREVWQATLAQLRERVM
jgi:putative nucleotidyltransferase with HDIG domain